MITPTPAEENVIRAACRRRFGAARPYLVRLEHPVDAAVAMAAFDLRSYSAHVDARQGDTSRQTMAASALAVDRLLWVSPLDPTAPTVDTLTASPELADPLTPAMLARLEELREAWPAIDGKIDVELRLAAGGTLVAQPTVRITKGNAPAGFVLPADAKERGPGALWLASWKGPTETVALVMRAPLPDVWSAAFATWNAAVAKGEGLVAASMRFAAEHVVWSAEPLAQLLDRLPAIGLNMREPLLAMGGHEAESSGTFL